MCARACVRAGGRETVCVLVCGMCVRAFAQVRTNVGGPIIRRVGSSPGIGSGPGEAGGHCSQLAVWSLSGHLVDDAKAVPHSQHISEHDHEKLHETTYTTAVR